MAKLRAGITASSGSAPRNEKWASPASCFSIYMERPSKTRSSKQSLCLGSTARRLLFLGDGRMWLSELKVRGGARQASEGETAENRWRLRARAVRNSRMKGNGYGIELAWI